MAKKKKPSTGTTSGVPTNYGAFLIKIIKSRTAELENCRSCFKDLYELSKKMADGIEKGKK